MRTPLGNALFFVKSLKNCKEIKKSGQAIKYLGLVESSLFFMQTFVDDLLDLQKIENHEFKLDNQTVFDPNEALELVRTIFAPQTKKKNVNLIWLKMKTLYFPIESVIERQSFGSPFKSSNIELLNSAMI